jgi:histone H3/H4
MDKERLLPIASVSKISKSVIPENSKVSQESKVSIQECATEFISFLTSQGII